MPNKTSLSNIAVDKNCFYNKICEESMCHGCGQMLLRVETCAHHVLTGTYDKRIITGLNCSY